MRIIPPTEPSAAEPTLDRSREVVVFDPWPFAIPRLVLGKSLPYIDNSGHIFAVTEYVRPAEGLGWLTDGRQCVVGRVWIEANGKEQQQ